MTGDRGEGRGERGEGERGRGGKGERGRGGEGERGRGGEGERGRGGEGERGRGVEGEGEDRLLNCMVVGWVGNTISFLRSSI